MGNKDLSNKYITTLKVFKGDEWYEAAMVSDALPEDEDWDFFLEEVKKELARGVVS